MTTTGTRSPGSASTDVTRRARLGAVGGGLLALSPAVWATDLEGLATGTPGFVAVAASYWLVAVVGPALVVVGVTALRAALGPHAGRAGSAGALLAAGGFAAVALGNAVEMASLSAGGGTVPAGYAVSYLGMLVGFLGSLLLGITLLRRRSDPLARTAGWLLALAIPLAVGLGVLFATMLPGYDAGFAVATSVPTGIAWALLGTALARDGHPAAA